MQQIYKRTPMPKCDLSKVAKQLYWNSNSEWMFSCKFTAYFQNTFPQNTSAGLLLQMIYEDMDESIIMKAAMLIKGESRPSTLDADS